MSLWQKFAVREYRRAFATAMLKKMVSFQIRAICKQRGWSQNQLAARAGLNQGVISRALDPDYGNLTLNTIGRIAGGFDLAFVGRFVPFSELATFTEAVTEDWFGKLKSFDEDNL